MEHPDEKSVKCEKQTENQKPSDTLNVVRSGDKQETPKGAASYRTEEAFSGEKLPEISAVPADTTKLFSVLSYLSVFWVVSLLVKPDDPTVKFHVNQGILLSIMAAAFSLIIAVLNAVFVFLPFMLVFTTLLSVVAGVIVFGLMVIGFINAVQKQEKPLPVIGQIYTFIR